MRHDLIAGLRLASAAAAVLALAACGNWMDGSARTGSASAAAAAAVQPR